MTPGRNVFSGSRSILVYLRGRLLLEGSDYCWPEDSRDTPVIYEARHLLEAGDTLALIDHAGSSLRKSYVWDSKGWLPSDGGLVESLAAIPGVATAVPLGDRDESYDQPWVLTTEPDLEAEAVGQIKIRAAALLKGLSYWGSPVLVRPPGSEGDALEAEWRLW